MPGNLLTFIQANVQDPWQAWLEKMDTSLLSKISHVFFYRL